MVNKKRKKLKKINIKKICAVLCVMMLLNILLIRNIYANEENKIVIKNTNMYNGIVAQLEGQVAFTKNDKDRIIFIEEDELKKVTKLKLNNLEIKDISGIERFTNLKELNLSNNNIADINALASLTNLVNLQIYGCNISDLSPISNLTKLQVLNISKNVLDYKTSTEEECCLNKLSKLTNLEELDVSHNYIKYTKGIETLVKLNKLILYDNTIKDLKGLDGLNNLTYLSVGKNNDKNYFQYSAEDLALINKLTNLEYLDFSENFSPEIINNINNLTNLKEISLQGNKILDITNIQNLTKLEKLDLFNNLILEIDSISKLPNLTEVTVGKNGIKNIACLFNDDNLVFNNLKKLDISSNKINETLCTNEINKLKKMSINSEIEFNYENIVNTENLPHKDGKILYVTYEDFGARCDGEYDDFIAIRNAHTFANKNGYEVRATSDKKYHIFKLYEDSVAVNTNTDWCNSKFIIHDEIIEKYSGRFKSIFTVNNMKNADVQEIKNPSFTVGKETKQIPGLEEAINKLKNKGFDYKYLCTITNSEKKQYIRYGMNANSGADQQDYVIVDENGKVLNDIQWDFDKITSIKLSPIPKEKFYVRNGDFVSNSIESLSETPYTRSGSNKSIYLSRNIVFNNCGNIDISGIKHSVTIDELSGSYSGFIYVNGAADVNIYDCELYTRKFSLSGRSTYDLNLARTVNIVCKNITSNNIYDEPRWGIMGSNYSKDARFENCVMNRIDAHCGIYNLDVINCEIGMKGFTMIGQGTLNIYNTKITSDGFINLRSDYGSTWNGDMNIVGCTFRFYGGGNSPRLFKYGLSYDDDGSVHDFGYDCKFPNVYIENLKIDNEKNTRFKDITLIPNSNTTSADFPEWYAPKSIVINGYEFVNNTLENANIVPSVNKLPKIENIVFTKYKIYSEGKEITSEFRKMDSDKYVAKNDVNFIIDVNNLSKNTFSIVKDNNVIIDNKEINEKYENTFSENGEYEIIIKSVENKNGYEGAKSIFLNIEKENNLDNKEDDGKQEEEKKEEDKKEEDSKINETSETNKNEGLNDGIVIENGSINEENKEQDNGMKPNKEEDKNPVEQQEKIENLPSKLPQTGSRFKLGYIIIIIVNIFGMAIIIKELR